MAQYITLADGTRVAKRRMTAAQTRAMIAQAQWSRKVEAIKAEMANVSCDRSDHEHASLDESRACALAEAIRAAR